MAITNDEKDLLNTYAGGVAAKVQLGTLIKNAETGGLGAGSVGTTELAALAVTTAKIAADAVDATKIADDAVSLEHLDSGIEPSHVVKFGGTFTTLGGDASETISVAGALGTDVVSVTVKTAGATPRDVVAAAAAANQINVTMSGDPSTDHVLQYLVFRAAT